MRLVALIACALFVGCAATKPKPAPKWPMSETQSQTIAALESMSAPHLFGYWSGHISGPYPDGRWKSHTTGYGYHSQEHTAYSEAEAYEQVRFFTQKRRRP